MEELNLRDVNFRGAAFVETYEDGTTGKWDVLTGGVNPGSIGFHLTRNHGTSGKTVLFYGGFWDEAVDAAARTITFTRDKKNSSNAGRFPDQPWAEVRRVVVTWK